MSREIKFRAWDSTEDRMLTGHELADLLLHGYGYGEKTTLLRVGGSSRPIELMQYTGLKDANGNEIYEGDIVKVSVRRDPRYWFGKVEQIGWTYRIESIEMSTWCLEDPCEEKLEVIGNIYENRELLEAGDAQDA